MTIHLDRRPRVYALVASILAGLLVLSALSVPVLADDDADAEDEKTFHPFRLTEGTLLDLEGLEDELDPFTMLALYIQFQELGELDTNLSEDSFYEVDSLEEVRDHLDGNFAAAGYLPASIRGADSSFGVGDAGYASYTFDVAVARTISELLEIPGDWLPNPAEHETLTLSLELPASGVAYWENDEHFLLVGQVGVPEIDIPEEIDFESLIGSILDDPRLPDDIAEQLAGFGDPDNTMPIPAPEGAEVSELTVNGDAGIMIAHDDGNAVIWKSDETIHVVAGTLTTDEIQRIVGSVR